MRLSLNRNRLLIYTLLWEGVFLFLSASQYNGFQVLNIVGFITLIGLPGILTIILLELNGLPLWAYVGLTIGFSVLELMLVALAGNTLLPQLGIVRPLDRPTLLVEFAFLVNALIAFIWEFKEEVHISLRSYGVFGSVRDALTALAPIAFVLMAIFGAIRLNNGASGVLTLIMLMGIGVYCLWLVWQGERLGPNVIPIALFFVSLALLLMTSLRGWYATGHDIQQEYSVFQLTTSSGIWSIANYRNAYNACLSITILPTIFSNVLSLFDPYVFKVLFQLLFSTLPGMLYLTVRRYVSSTLAFISVLYFIGFPTFFGDMPFINRQEIAFLFLILMIYVIFETDIPLRLRQLLFVGLGLGMILSHYSTTYIVLGLLILLVLTEPLVHWFSKKYSSRLQFFSSSGMAALRPSLYRDEKRIVLWMVALLLLATFVWSSTLTNTASGSLYRVFDETIAVMKSNVKQDTQSSDTSYSLLSLHTSNADQLFAQYLQLVIAPFRAIAPTGVYYPASTYEHYPIEVIADPVMPLTALGRGMEQVGINVVAFNTAVRQGSARLLQLLVIIGFAALLLSSRFLRKPLASDYVILSIGSIVFVFAQLVLPVLSTEYGLLRAFQQSLMFLSIFIVVGSLYVFVGLSNDTRITLAGILAVLFLLSSTGVFTQLLGGYGAQLHLNNSGDYYQLYYIHATDVASSDWLAAEIQKDTLSTSKILIQGDYYSTRNLSTFADANLSNDIYPGVVQLDSYVYLGFSDVRNHAVSLFYEGDNISYTYPLAFLDDNKNRIYDNGSALVYR